MLGDNDPSLDVVGELKRTCSVKFKSLLTDIRKKPLIKKIISK
jgi:hypothetical protein